MITKAQATDITFTASASSLTWNVYVSKDGGNLSAIAGTVEAITGGNSAGYVIHAGSADMNGEVIQFLVVQNTATNPEIHEITITTDSVLGSVASDIATVKADTATLKADTSTLKTDTTAIKTQSDKLQFDSSNNVLAASSTGGGGSIQWTYTTYTNSAMTTPLADCEVWISTDAAGSNVMAGPQYSNSFGITEWQLDAGTYYIWRKKDGLNFANPAREVVS